MKIGDRYLFTTNDIDPQELECTVTSILDDHAILTTDDGIALWYEEDWNDELFKQI